MATVRMSQQLARELVKKACAAYKLSNPAPADNPILKNRVRDSINRMPVLVAAREFAKQPEVALSIQRADAVYRGSSSSLASQFISLVKEDEVTEIVVHGCGEHGFKVELDTPIKVPYKDWTRWNVNIEDFADEDKHELRAMIMTAESNETAWTDEYQKFEKSIELLVDSVNTVKQLLDVWPAAEKLLDSDIVQKLHKKVTRKVDARAVLDKSQFDPDAANQVMLTASLLGD